VLVFIKLYYFFVGDMEQNTTPVSTISGPVREPMKKKQKCVVRNDPKVQEDIDMVHADDGCMWFLESSNHEGKSLGDIHLFVSNHSRSYSDMGMVLNLMESISRKGKPCFEVVCMSSINDECNRFYLSLESFKLEDMEGSMQHHSTSFAKLGWPSMDFNKILEEGIEDMDIIIQGFLMAKEATVGENSKVDLPKGKKKNRKSVSKIGGNIAREEGKLVKCRKVPKKATIDVGAIVELPDIASVMPLMIVEPQHQNVATLSNHLDSMCKNVEKGVESLARWKSYYPFGMNASFEIDVMNCTPAPSHMVYRGLVKEHVTKLLREFCSKPQHCIVLADLMPYDPKTNLPLENVQRNKIQSLHYWIISRQHSIEAAKKLQHITYPSLEMIKRTYRYRTSRILVNCPCKDSVEISKEANILLAKVMQKEPYLTQLKQARGQWVAFGRPSAPKAGSHKGDQVRKSWEVCIFLELKYSFKIL